MRQSKRIDEEAAVHPPEPNIFLQTLKKNSIAARQSFYATRDGAAVNWMATGGSYKIGGLDVLFPHQPYGVQFTFMAKVVQTLNEKGTNALLEVRTSGPWYGSAWLVLKHCWPQGAFIPCWIH